MYMTPYLWCHFNVMAGPPNVDGFLLVIKSTSNTVMDITVGGTTYSSPTDFSFTAIGGDTPGDIPAAAVANGYNEACFKSTLLVTGITGGFQKVPYSITQKANDADQNARTEIQNAYTSPGLDDKFTCYAATCDKRNEGRGFQDVVAYANTPGTPPCIMYLHVDDIGYVDGLGGDVDDALYSGHVSGFGVGRTINNEYQTCIQHMGSLGMFESTPLGERLNAPFRGWVYRNMNLAFQWGNHEFDTDMGSTESPIDQGFPNDFHETDPATNPGVTGFDGFAHNAYKHFYGDLVGTNLKTTGNDTESSHWAYTLGNICFVAPDPITKFRIDNNDNVTVQFGTSQIEDILNALDNDSALKVLLTNKTPRDGITEAAAIAAQNSNWGIKGVMGHYPLETRLPAEFDRLFSDDSSAPFSIMKNDRTNGVSGNFVVMNGDHHLGMVAHNRKAAGANTLEESFYTINLASVSGSSFHIDSITILGNATADVRPYFFFKEGHLHNNIFLEYAQIYGFEVAPAYDESFNPVYFEPQQDPRGWPPHIVRIECDPSNDPCKITVRVMRDQNVDDVNWDDRLGDMGVMWERSFVKGMTDNRGVMVNDVVSNQSKLSLSSA